VLSRVLALVVAGALVAAAVVGLVFAGSPAKIAEGVHVAGVDVGGLTGAEAVSLLEQQAAAVAQKPVTFVAGGDRWHLTPSELGVRVDWAAAVEAARREGEGFGPVRGIRRLRVRVFGADVAPATQVYRAALGFQLGRIAASLDQPATDARIRLNGLEPVVVGSKAGRALDRRAAEEVVVRALADFQRVPVALPVRVEPPEVTAGELAPAMAQTRTALSAPVRLELGQTTWRLSRARVADLLALPQDGATGLAIAGPGAERYFGRVARLVNRKPVDADFAVRLSGVRVIPAKKGLALDVPQTASALLAAALSPVDRVAKVSVATRAPELTTAEARGMGITGLVDGYTTSYGGTPNRLHNVRLVARLIDNTLIAPGTTFSFNGTTGERTADKGFLEAPVIINGELQTGLGGGVCQVSTTVFNAAYEAGLPIDTRTNHALYISHYPLGRDATVNYPDIDLRFTNDTGHWLLLRTFVGSSSLTVNLYGTPVARKVVTESSPLVTLSGPRTKTVKDPSLVKGETVVEDSGEPSRATSVRRIVYDANGKVLHDSTWSSSYRAEPRLVRVGTKPKPKPEPKPKAPPKKQDPIPPLEVEPVLIPPG
jgi:vancomycin resistance protein YoaR